MKQGLKFMWVKNCDDCKTDYISGFTFMTESIDVGEGTSGTSADVSRFILEIYLVSNAIPEEYIFKNKLCEIKDLTLFTERILAK